MNPLTVAIVGANLAGGRAAEALRSEGYDGKVVLIGAEPHPPYERPPLSKQLLLGPVDGAAPLLRPASEWRDLGVDLRLETRVERIVPPERKLVFSDGESLQADRVILCTGSRCRRLNVPGAEVDGVVHLRTLDDSFELRERLRPEARVVVVGGGLIGAEVAAAAARLGCRPTVVDLDPLPMRRVLSPQLARRIMDLHRDHGVRFVMGSAPEAIESDRCVRAVRLSSGVLLEADVVVVGIGVVPATELAAHAGATVENGVVVDEYGWTSLDGVLAAGDVANHPASRFGIRLRQECWDHAQRHAVIAATNLLARKERYDCVPWFWSDQHDVNIQIGGLPALADETVSRGDLDDLSFCEFGLQNGRIVSVTGFNRARDVRRTLPLIAAGITPAQDLLADDDYDLRQLRRPVTA